MTRDLAKGCIGVADQEIARYVTKYEMTQKLEIWTMELCEGLTQEEYTSERPRYPQETVYTKAQYDRIAGM